MKLYADYAHASISMVQDDEFKTQLLDVIQKKEITHFLETGTFNGLGSTTMVSEAILQSGVTPEVFYTLERDPYFFEQARTNLARFPFVKPVCGLSVDEKEAICFLENDDFLANHEKYSDIFIDDLKDPIGFYIREVRGNLSGMNKPRQGPFGWMRNLFSAPERRPETNLLEKLAAHIATYEPLILLDSAGGIGYLEFQIVMKVMKDKPFTLVLDDTHHIKHWRSRRDVLASDAFTVIYDSDKHGRTIASTY
jgi:hypothetical protein